MHTLAIDKDFMADLARLEKEDARTVLAVFEDFTSASQPEQVLERLEAGRNPRFRSMTIDQTWRAIFLAPQSGDVYTALRILPDEEARRWTETTDVSVNAVTKGIEMRNDGALDEALPELVSSADNLFCHFSDSGLRRLGIDDKTLQVARTLTSEGQLLAAKQILPSTQWDVLFDLSAGYTADEVFAQMGAALDDDPFDASDLDSAVLRSRSRISLIEDQDELLMAFAYPFATWRVYLHPSQRKVVEASFAGPARVTGGPGTGKTIVALHRAYNLAQRSAGRVLLTTFTTNLCEELQSRLEMLADDENVESRIEIITIDKLATRLCKREHRVLKRVSREDENQLWDEIIDQLGLQLSASILASEWRQVALALQVTSQEEYVAAKADGMGRLLTPEQAVEVWNGLQAFEQTLHRRGAWTHETIRREAIHLLDENPEKPYRHVIVDEAQDLSADQWRLLRAAVPDGPDDIFVAGDTHQRIYDNYVTLHDVGIDVEGRSSELDLNYRTTAEILAWSLELLRGEPIDDMEGGLESIARCRSALRGQAPRLVGLSSSAAEVQYVTEAVIDWISQGVDPSDIGIATRTHRLASWMERVIRAEGIPTFYLSGDQNLGGGVGIGTMHGMKGLEFRCVAIPGLSASLFPEKNSVTPAGVDKHAHEQDIEREKCLLFVACTRAREELLVTWNGKPSPFLHSIAAV